MTDKNDRFGGNFKNYCWPGCLFVELCNSVIAARSQLSADKLNIEQSIKLTHGLVLDGH